MLGWARVCAAGVALVLASAGCRPTAATRTLHVYTPLDEDITEYAEERLEEMWADVNVRITRVDDSTALARIRAGETADVWWGADASALTAASAEERLDFYRPQWVEAGSDIAGVDERDHWQVALVSPLVIAFNREATPISRAPRDWIDLHHPRWRGQITVPNPLAEPGGAALVHGFLAHSLSEDGDEVAGFDRLMRLDASVRLYSADAERAVQALRTREALIAVIPLHEAERLRHDDRPWLHYRHPESGAPALVRGVAVLAGAGQPELAREFIELAGGEFATRAAEHDWWLPSTNRLQLVGLPKDHFLPGDARPWRLDPALLAREGPGWLERWDREVRHQGSTLY